MASEVGAARRLLAAALCGLAGSAPAIARIVLEYAPIGDGDACDCDAYGAGDWGTIRDPVACAGRTGDLRLLSWALAREAQHSPWWIGERLARGGCLGLLRCARAAVDFEGVVQAAAEEGRLDVLRWVRAVGGPVDPKVVQDNAAWGGHLDVLRWAVGASGWASAAGTLLAAANRGHTHILRWAQKRGAEGDYRQVCEAAAAAGHLGVLQWAHASGLLGGAVIGEATKYAHVSVVRWARANGVPWSADGKDLARFAHHGDLEACKWALGDGCPWSPEVPSIAAGLDRQDMLQWAKETGHPFLVKTDRNFSRAKYHAWFLSS